MELNAEIFSGHNLVAQSHSREHEAIKDESQEPTTTTGAGTCDRHAMHNSILSNVGPTNDEEPPYFRTYDELRDDQQPLHARQIKSVPPIDPIATMKAQPNSSAAAGGGQDLWLFIASAHDPQVIASFLPTLPLLNGELLTLQSLNNHADHGDAGSADGANATDGSENRP